MGDPKRIRKKYSRPRHPWEGGRIENEKHLQDEYGLVNKKEIWKMDSLLKDFKDQVKKLTAMEGEQAEKEKEQLMDKLYHLGLVEKGTPMQDVLRLDIEEILERRLQSRVCRQGLARTMKQARQFIVHEHITVDGKKVNIPSYIVRRNEEISFAENSPYKDEMHPERIEEKPSKTEIEEPEDEEKDEIKEEAYEEEDLAEEGETSESPAQEIKGLTKQEIADQAEEKYGVEISTNQLKDEMKEEYIEKAKEQGE